MDRPQLAETLTDSIYSSSNNRRENERGINVYYLSSLRQISGRTQTGERVQAPVQIPLFQLTPLERESIVQANSDVLSITLSRQNKIASLDWKVEPKKKAEDKIVEKLKSFRQLFMEFSDLNSLRHSMIRYKSLQNIKIELPDVRDDLNNFDTALLRWKRRGSNIIEESAEKVTDWIEAINPQYDFFEYKKLWIFNLLTHGADGHFLKVVDNKLEYLSMLPGGSIFPLRSAFVSSLTGFTQMLPGYEPRIYFNNEIIFNSYMPTAARSYGMIPLESLINKVAESLMFDRLAAERADGTKPPEKLIVFGEENSMAGGFLNTANLPLPVDGDEQERLEQIVNEERRNAIRVITGKGRLQVEDISKADTFSEQSKRQIQLKKDIGGVYQASSLEMSLTGSGDVSGRATAESMERQERQRGIYPLVQIIDTTINRRILPLIFPGWRFEHHTELSEVEGLRLDIMKVQDSTRTVNEIREDRGDIPFPGDEFNKPFSVGNQGKLQQFGEMSDLMGRE